MLNTRTRQAIVNALTKAGYAAAIMQDWEYEGDLKLNTEVYISDDLGSVGDYYSEYYEINPKVKTILDKYKCYGEWYDCAVLSVCRI